ADKSDHCVKNRNNDHRADTHSNTHAANSQRIAAAGSTGTDQRKYNDHNAVKNADNESDDEPHNSLNLSDRQNIQFFDPDLVHLICSIFLELKGVYYLAQK